MDEDQKTLDKLEVDIKNWPKFVERNRRKGQKINSDPNILKRRLYSKFVTESRSKKLSPLILNWMGDFVENGPYDDIRKYVNDHEWVSQYREMKAQR